MDVSHEPERPETPSRFWMPFKYWLAGWPEWVSLILLSVTLGIALRSIEQAHWITPQPNLLAVLIISILTGLVVIRSPLPFVAKFCLAVLSIIAVTIWQAPLLLPHLETASGAKQFSIVLTSLWEVISNSAPRQNTVHFALFLIVISWAIGYVSTWFILRKKNAWLATIIGAFIIIANLSQLTEESYIFFPLYVLAAILLLVQVNLLRQNKQYQSRKRSATFYNSRVTIYFLLLMLLVSDLIITGTWFVPEIRANQVQVFIAKTMPARGDIETSWINMFASVPKKQSSLESVDLEKLPFTASFDRSSKVRFIITSPKQLLYWRTMRYDVYHSWGWSINSASKYTLGQSVLITEAESLSHDEVLTYTVENKLKTDILLTAGKFISSNVPVVITSTRADLKTAEVMALTSSYWFNYGDTYKVTSRITTVTPAELSQAGENYNREITARYLQLPPDLPRSLTLLSRDITGMEKTSYDKAKAIIEYLSHLSYVEAGYMPPEGVDNVEYFLFRQKSGNCTNFASAAVVMLRTVGIPARLATGYLAHEWDESNTIATIRANDYHAWVEVYFPGYGWIEFEATPRPDIKSGVISHSENPPDESGISGAPEPDNSSPLTDDSEAIDDKSSTKSGGVIDDKSSTKNGGVIDDQNSTSDGNFISEMKTLATGQSLLKLALVAACVILFLLILWAIVGRWRRPRVDLASRIYTRMCFLASLAGIRAKAQETPLEYCARLSLALPEQTEAINNIAHTYNKNRFSPRKQLTKQDKDRLRRFWRVVFRALLKRVLRITTTHV